MDHWVNENDKLKCTVCNVEYRIKREALPFWTIFGRNRAVLLIFAAQILIPLAFYSFLFFGAYRKTSWFFYASHFFMLGIMYYLYWVQYISKIERYRKRVISREPNDGEENERDL
jgi:hypothetical protein